MKIRFFKTMLFLSILFVTSSFRHPLKLTASLIEYKPTTTSIRMECRVFIDDFENSLNKENFNAHSLSKEDQAEIEYFFDQFYTIQINGKKFPLNFKSSEILEGYNVLVIKFAENDLKIKKGDHLLVENKLLFEQFGSLQSNRMTIRIPPFFAVLLDFVWYLSTICGISRPNDLKNQ